MAAGAVLVFGTAIARYRAWHLRWGATDVEVANSLPGDELIRDAQFVATRALTVHAPPEAVWPWLVQIGWGRAGFYSYDLVDNLGRPSAERILPEWQRLAVGDVAAPMAPGDGVDTSFRVAGFDAPHWLLWRKPDSTWVWVLVPDVHRGTRLITRVRVHYPSGPRAMLPLVLMEIGDFPMMRRQLLGVKRRAEGLAAQR